MQYLDQMLHLELLSQHLNRIMTVSKLTAPTLGVIIIPLDSESKAEMSSKKSVAEVPVERP